MISNVIAEIAYISKLINAPATDNVLEALRTLDKEILVDIPVVTVHAPSLEQYNSFLKNN